ncbi:MAG TPA: DUF5666 domain-containing protein [Terriglobia bacterium]|nr:DUF5666 domain-containing protein [Terriglobia bacterium]
MSRNRAITAVLGLIGACSLALMMSLPGLALQNQSDTGFNLEGKITEVTAGKLTVSEQDNIVFHVSYDDKTQIHRKDGSAGTAQDLKVGERIKVEGELNPAGVVEARRIDLE